MSSLVLLQIASGATLAAYRGLDCVNIALTGSDNASNAQNVKRRLAYALLLGSALAVPAKGVAHLLQFTQARKKAAITSH